MHAASRRKLVVLDDDPTGTQTVYDVPVLTTWQPAELAREFANDLPCFYILTNTRAFAAAEAVRINEEIARNLIEASMQPSERH
ncbi:MAG: four-carbon acid sugar kinase family protein, partial [Luteolibacter sp.]